MPLIEVSLSIAIQVITAVATIVASFIIIKQKVHSLEKSVAHLEKHLEERLNTIFRRTDENKTRVQTVEKSIIHLPTTNSLENKFVLKVEFNHLSENLKRTEAILKEQLFKTETKIDNIALKLDRLLSKGI